MAELIFPSSPAAGDLFPDPALPGVSQWIWDGSRWNLVQGGASVTVSNTPPGNPNNGDLWFDAENLKLFVWYDDGATAQWVVANPSGGGGGGASFEPDTTGSGETFVLQDQPTVNQPLIIGVTDGSSAAAGQIGEVISSVVPGFPQVPIPPNVNTAITSLVLTPGDWDVYGNAGIGLSSEVATGIFVSLSLTTDPGSPSLTGSTTGERPSGGYVGGQINYFAITTCHISVAVPTTFYLIGLVETPGLTATGRGRISARRVR